MKKLTLSLFLLALCVMAGCSSQTAGGPAASDAEQSKTEITAEPAEKPAPEPAKIKLSATELVQKFEENYNSCGASGLMTDGQLGAELDALRSLASTNNIELPSDYEQQYRDWRAPLVMEKADAIHTAYMDYLTSGSLLGENGTLTTYADYVDFDMDGWDELLVIKRFDFNENIKIFAEVDSYSESGVITLGNISGRPYGSDRLSFSRCSSDSSQVYLHMSSPEYDRDADCFCTVKNGLLVTTDSVEIVYSPMWLSELGYSNSYYILSNFSDDESEQEISKEKYDALIAKYEDTAQIVSSANPNDLGHGILTDYMTVSLTEDDRQYRTNLFLSNFSEQGFGSFNRNDIDIGQLVDFVHRFADINSPGNLTIIDDGIEWPKVSFSLDYFNKVTMRFFGRSFSSDEVSHATLKYGFSDYRFQNNTFYGEMLEHGDASYTFSVVRQIYRLNNNTYWIEYSIFGSEKVDSEFMKQCYKMDYSKASNSPDLYSPYYSSDGVAIVEVLGSGSEERYHLISYSGR